MQIEHTHQSPKRHCPLVSLLLWRKMVATCCFVWPLGLGPWSVIEAEKISSFDTFKKNSIFGHW